MAKTITICIYVHSIMLKLVQSSKHLTIVFSTCWNSHWLKSNEFLLLDFYISLFVDHFIKFFLDGISLFLSLYPLFLIRKTCFIFLFPLFSVFCLFYLLEFFLETLKILILISMLTLYLILF